MSGPPGRQQLLVDGVRVWPRVGFATFHGAPVFSADGHGLALREEGAQGPRLVVLVDYPDPRADLTWAVPHEALGEGLRLFWVNDSRVAIGSSTLAPKFAVSWRRER